MELREAGRLTDWTPGQIDLMVRNGLVTYYKKAGRIMVDVGLLHKLKVRAIAQQAQALAQRARARKLRG